MQLSIYVVAAVAIIITSCLNKSTAYEPPVSVIVTPQQLFNCTSHKTNFCIGLMNNSVSINDEGCIKNQNCEVIVHGFRSRDKFTTYFACSNPDCIVYFIIYYDKKVKLMDDEAIESMEDVKWSIPNAIPFAEANLNQGVEQLNYYVKFILGHKRLNGYRGTRTDSKLDIQWLNTKTSEGKKISYKIGKREEKSPKGYNWDIEKYSVVVVQLINDKVVNMIDGLEPVLLFDEETEQELRKEATKRILEKTVAMAGKATTSHVIVIMSMLLSITYYLLK